jgi:hypothetical protein
LGIELLPSGGVLIDLARDETFAHRNVTSRPRGLDRLSHWNWKVRDSLKLTPGTADAWRKRANHTSDNLACRRR